ncbi:uncharacterized protein C16orf96 homolog isoform X1 [Mauremys mutica]|uniref:DUF4795 domain-containing protein n=2 Tax=Mauremys mutica TaxID=74926 RepID=A0A9D3XPC7_9SAUR|nr:uncharacterized protein C16orf96 homolog isoform X1 [Mauremys mutica]KAH1184339.1 hypothetical protein KIL84_014955 [Mauremys mutica]
MSFSVTFAELVNIAIGTPELGNVNFNALHVLLHGLLEHLQLQGVKKEISQEERDFLQPAPSFTAEGQVQEQVSLERKSSSLFHQLQERLTRIESQLFFLNNPPTTEQLLSRSQPLNKPAEEMWQMMQLKKKMEMNEEGMTKAMNTLQELLTNIYSLQSTVNTFQEELGVLKDNFQRVSMDEMRERLAQLDQQSQLIQAILDRLDKMQAQLSSFPEQVDIVQWSSLFDSLTDKSPSDPVPSLDSKRETVREAFGKLCQLPDKHEALGTRISLLENELKQQADHLAKVGISDDVAADLERMKDEISSLQSKEDKGREFQRDLLAQVQKLKEQYEKLQKGSERLLSSMGDFQNLRAMVQQLDLNKADKALLEQEMNVKADKSALEAMVNHRELQSATTQLSEMMQDLLQKMSLQDKDWQKALEKLFSDMDSKLDHMALDPLRKQLEEVWKFIKKYLSEGPRFDADSAAGFKRQLFERVKCISCDRPVAMMTGPHLVTVRKANLLSRPRPASANGYEYLALQQRAREQAVEGNDGREMTSCRQLSSQQCWQCQAHAAYPIKRLSKVKALTTMYPYGDPTVLTYDNSEVDILGINGVLYKGRVSSQLANRSVSLEKEFSAAKTPRPPSKHGMERTRSATYGSHYVSPYASSVVRTRATSAGSKSQLAQELPACTVRVKTELPPGQLPSEGAVAGL